MRIFHHLFRSKWSKLLLILLPVLLLAACASTQTATVKVAAGHAAAGQAKAQEALAIGTDAYIYGYSLVTMEMTRQVMTNVVAPDGMHAPMGQFANAREYPTAAFRDVTAPNADTLYSAAWLDLSKEPYVLSLPDEKGRYYLMPMLSGWTNVFAVPGKRTTGTKAQTYAITGPNWKGTLPKGIEELKAPTNMVWVLGRTYCTGPRRIIRPSTLSRTSTSWFRSVPTVNPTRRLLARSTRTST